jgi:hypothetical protein
MGPHVHGFRNSRGESDRADVIEKDERPDHVPARVRQHTADFESTQVAAALVDYFHAESFTRPTAFLSRIMGTFLISL